MLTAAWSLQSRQEFDGQHSYKEAHPLQVLALFVLLGLHQRQSYTAWFREKTARLFQQAPKHRGIFIELLTGNGKSILLGFASLLFALLGCDVYCACYSANLSKRDYEAFQPLFKLFDVEEQVHYATISELAEIVINRQGNIRVATESFLRTGQVVRRSTQTRPPRPQIVFVDEVDTLNSPAFASETVDPLVVFKDEAATNLIKMIFNLDEPLRVDEILKKPECQALQSKFPRLKPFLHAEVTKMLSAKARMNSHSYRVINGKIGYKCQDGYTTSLYVGYQTVFAYLREAATPESGVKQQTADDQLGIQVTCGGYSYAKIIQTTTCIYGVTGTLKHLSPTQKKLLKDQFRVAEFRYMPNLYNESRRSDDGTVIEAEVGRYRQALVDKAVAVMNDKRPVLMFFATIEELEDFQQSAQYQAVLEGRDVTVLTEADSLKDVKHKIQYVTRPNRLLLATRVFGRGSDFEIRDPTLKAGAGTHVIQTFLSIDPSEEVQIRGRTARDKTRGSYELILCGEHLKKLLPDLDASVIQSGSYKLTPPELIKARDERFEDHMKQVKASMQACAAKHDKAQEYLTALFASPIDPDAVQARLEDLA